MILPSSQSGQSLIEVLVALGIFAAGMAAVGLLVIDASVAMRQGGERTKALLLSEEGIEAARSIRASGFDNIAAGTHGIALSGGVWTFSGLSDQTDQYARSVTVEDIEPAKKKITSTVSWQFGGARTGLVSLVTYLTNFLQKLWLQTTFADFDGGKKNSVRVTNNSGGEVELALLGDFAQAAAHATFDTDGNGDVRAVLTDGDTLYTGADSTAGDNFIAVDISDISSGIMAKKGGANISGNIMSVSVSNGYAFLATTNNSQELVVVRLSDFAQVNSLDLQGGADGLSTAISGTTLLLGRFSSGNPELYEIDISNPLGALAPGNTLNVNGNVSSIVTENGYAFLAASDSSQELVVVRLSDFAQVNSLDLQGASPANDLAVLAGDLYLARDASGDPEIYRINVSSPEGPLSVAASADVSGNANGVTAPGNGRIYLATSDPSRHLSVRDAVTVSETGSGSISSPPNAVAFFGGFAYLASGNNSSEITAVKGGFGGWGSPVLIGSFNSPSGSDANDVFISGNFAYLVTANNGSGAEFYIIDISNPSAPSLTGSLNLGTAANSVFVSGNFAYLATPSDSKELIIVNVTNKASPFEAGSYDSERTSDGLSVFVSGTTAYLGTANNGGPRREFYALNVSVPTSITLLGSYEAGHNVNGISIDGTRAFLSTANNSKELQVINVSSPAAMTEIASYNTPGNADSNGVYFELGRVYLSADNGGGDDLYIFDASSLPSLPLLGSVDISTDALDVAVSGGRAFVAGISASLGLTVVDVSTPALPLILSAFDTGGTANGVIFSGNMAYLATANDSRELQIVGEGSAPTERVREGRFTSSAFDSLAAGTAWQTIRWTASGAGSVQFRLRTASTEAGLQNAKWVGPDGTNGTIYTVSGTAITADPGASGTQWIQYKAYLSGTGAATPVLEDITLVYN